MGLWSVRWLNGGPAPSRLGAGIPYAVPYGIYRTADGWLTVAARGEKFWSQIAVLIGLEELLTDSRFATNEDRLAHRDELDDYVAKALRKDTTARWIKRLAGLPVAPINDIPAALQDEHVTATNGVGTLDHDGISLRAPTTPIRWEGEDPVATLPRTRGADTATVLRSAGYSDQEIAELVTVGAVGAAV
jgi:CoA:oxalate CoA-transferase